MTRYSDQIRDEFNRPVEGALVYVYDETLGTIETLTADDASPLPNPVVTDAYGEFYFNTDDGTKQLEVHFGGRVRWKELIQVGSLPAGPPGGNVMSIGLATAIAGMALATPDLAGTDTFRTSGYTTQADGGEAYYRRMSGIEAVEQGEKLSADGVRLGLAEPKEVTLEMFGARRNESSGPAQAANNAALTAALLYGANTWDTFYGTSRKIRCLDGEYYFSQSYFNVKKAVLIQGGSGSGEGSGYPSTRFIGPVNWKGLIFHAHNTVNETVEGVPTTSAAGSVVENIHFIGNANSQANLNNITAGHGIRMRCAISIRNCRFELLYDGVKNHTTVGGGGAIEGQASIFAIRDCTFVQNRNAGLLIEGSDANAGIIDNCNFIANGRAGLWDHSFLGNFVSGGHFRDNGARTDYWNLSSQVTHGGNRYYVNETATTATTDAALRVGNPSTNALWSLEGAGGVHANYPDFASFVGTFQKGGPILMESSTNQYGRVEGYYTEGGQPPVFLGTTCFASPMLGTAVGAGTWIIAGVLRTVKDAYLSQTIFAKPVASAVCIMTAHNSQAAAAGLEARLGFAQGYQANGAELVLATISARGTSGSGATTEGVMVFTTRTFGTLTNAQTDRMVLDGVNQALRPNVTNTMDLGYTDAFRWKKGWFVDLDYSGTVKRNGTQILGAQGAAVADAVNAVAAPTQAEFNALVTQLNALLARVRAHGLIA